MQAGIPEKFYHTACARYGYPGWPKSPGPSWILSNARSLASAPGQLPELGIRRRHCARLPGALARARPRSDRSVRRKAAYRQLRRKAGRRGHPLPARNLPWRKVRRWAWIENDPAKPTWAPCPAEATESPPKLILADTRLSFARNW